MTARPRRVERDEVHAVSIERRPGQCVAEDELDGDRGNPHDDPGPVPELPRCSGDQQERDHDLPGQRHDLRDRDAGRMELGMEQRHGRLEQGRRR
jgi:hypothetical protein